MTKIFLECYPYHSETLYPYVVNFADENDIILYERNSHGSEILEMLPQRKYQFSIFKLMELLLREKIQVVHINSISVNLHGDRFAAWSKTIKILMVPYICRLLSFSELQGIVHEAEQYYPTDITSNKRHIFFQKFFGRFHVRLFKKIYVLAPEVKIYLNTKTPSLNTKTPSLNVLSTKPLSELYPSDPFSEDGKKRCVWIGAVERQRRDWKMLLTLRKQVLSEENIIIDMVCDIRAAEGPILREKIKQLGLSSYFNFREYRPDDRELFTAVRNSALVLCLYANKTYGKSKTSGARHIALAYDKPSLVWEEQYKILNSTGEQSSLSTDLNVTLANS